MYYLKFKKKFVWIWSQIQIKTFKSNSDPDKGRPDPQHCCQEEWKGAVHPCWHWKQFEEQNIYNEVERFFMLLKKIISDAKQQWPMKKDWKNTALTNW